MSMSTDKQPEYDIDVLKKHYDNIEDKLQSMAVNIKNAVKGFLDAEKIEYLDVFFRIKKFDSFIEKIEDRKYQNPFDETEDLCGLRIICFYVGDIRKIAKIIEREFDVLNWENKADNLDADRFGYLSEQGAVKIKNSWCNAPEWRGLNQYKAEIQIRTVSMHAWAEIEHKLNYKKKKHIPKQLQRRIYRLSALFELADEQFETFRNAQTEYTEKLVKLYGDRDFNLNQELNLDSLQLFLDILIPNKATSLKSTRGLLDELFAVDLSLDDVYQSYQRTSAILHNIEKEYYSKTGKRFSQTGTIKCSLDITDNYYYSSHDNFEIEKELREKWKKELEIHKT